MEEELKSLLETMRHESAEMRQELAAMRQENVVQHAETRKYVEDLVAAAQHENGIRFERLERRFDFVAETLAWMNPKIDREGAAIRDEMRERFAETNSLIRFAYRDLDRRVTVLEQQK